MGKREVEVSADDRLTGGSAEIVETLRQRHGDYDLLPASRDVLALRQRPDARAAELWLAGELGQQGRLWDLLGVAAHADWRGKLVVVASNDGTRREVFLEHGAVVAARSSHHDERLGAVLSELGVLSSEALAQIAGTNSAERFGETAVTLGLLSREQLFAGISVQVEKIFYALLAVPGGSFYFEDGLSESEIFCRVHANMVKLLIDGMNQLDQQREADADHDSQRLHTNVPLPELAEIVERFNQAVRAVQQALESHAFGEDISGQLAAFIEGNEVLTALREVHQPDGTLAGDVAQHLQRAQISRAALSGALHEAAGFAVFVAESTLVDADPISGTQQAAFLASQVSEITEPLSPKG